MKKLYVTLDIDVREFFTEDVVRTSGAIPTFNGWQDGEKDFGGDDLY